MENKETNLFDLLVKFVRWCAGLLRGCVSLLGGMLRLTYQHWVTVCMAVVLLSALSLYYSRPGNRRYRADILLKVNGNTHAELKQVLMPVLDPVNDSVAPQMSMSSFVGDRDAVKGIRSVKAHYVIDCLRDSTIDYIDWDGKSSLSDTLNFVAPNYLALRVVTLRPDLLPRFQAALLNTLNSSPVLRSNYLKFKEQHERNYAIYNSQISKIDSLTTRMYLEEPTQIGVDLRFNSLLVGEQRRQTFSDELRDFIRQAEYEGHLVADCEAPVVAVGDFAVHHRAVNGPLRMLALAIMAGWIAGVLIALLIERRKNIKEYLKR